MGSIYSQTNQTGPSAETNWTTDLVSQARVLSRGGLGRSPSYAAGYHELLCGCCDVTAESGTDRVSCTHGAKEKKCWLLHPAGH